MRSVWLGVWVMGGLGAVTRFFLSQWVAPITVSGIPLLGTAIVNLTGCFLIGLCHSALPTEWRPALISGFLGGLTTFSALEVEALTLLFRHGLGVTGGFLMISVLTGLLACGLGNWVARGVGLSAYR
jgi:fluoride exporter